MQSTGHVNFFLVVLKKKNEQIKQKKGESNFFVIACPVVLRETREQREMQQMDNGNGTRVKKMDVRQLE